MSNEIRVQSTMTVQRRASNQSNLLYNTVQTAFFVDQDDVGGPVPGYLDIAAHAVSDVDMSQLTSPGMCEIWNIDEVNYCTYGLYDVVTGKFYPLGEAGPGENYVIKLSRYIQEELAGTGSHEDHATTFRVEPGRGLGCKVIVNVMER